MRVFPPKLANEGSTGFPRLTPRPAFCFPLKLYIFDIFCVLCLAYLSFRTHLSLSLSPGLGFTICALGSLGVYLS